MMKFHQTIAFLCLALPLQACNVGPDTPRPINQAPKAIKEQPKAPSLSARESEYASLLRKLEQRDPHKEAQQAMANGSRSLKGYYAGRAGLKIPGLTQDQQARQRCSLETLDGLGDVIYGENHLKYRVALRKFAKAYNTAMLPACL